MTPPGPQGGQPSKRFLLVDSTPPPAPIDAADVDNTPPHGPGSGGSVNVNGVNDHDDAGAGYPDGERCPDWQDAYEERAAIMEHDGGLPRSQAEAEALADTLRGMPTATPIHD